MKKLLESLWYDYVSQESARTPELDAASAKITQSREFLLGDLNADQKTALLEYEDCLNAVSAVTEKEAFIKGVRFAVTFLTAASRDG